MTNQEPVLRNTCQRRSLQGDQLFNQISLYFRKRFILNVASAFMIHPPQLRQQFGAYLWCCSRVKQETARKYLKKVAFPKHSISNFLMWENKKIKNFSFELLCVTIISDRDSFEHTSECWSWMDSKCLSWSLGNFLVEIRPLIWEQRKLSLLLMGSERPCSLST